MQTLKQSSAGFGPGSKLAVAAILAAVLLTVLTARAPIHAAEASDTAPGVDAHIQGTLWVANRDLGELAVFDADDGTLLGRVSVGAGAHDVCVSERYGKAFVTAETEQKVAVVDLRRLDTTFIAVSPLPHHCEVSHDDETLYVSLASHDATVGTPQVAVINIEDSSVRYLTTNANPAARSHGLFASREGDKLFVAHDMGNAVSVLSLDAGAPDPVDFSIPGVPRAEEPLVSRSGEWLWVSARGDNTIKRINLAARAIDGVVPVAGVQPESIMLTPNEKTLVVSLRGTPASLAFADAVTLESLGSLPIGPSGTFGDLAIMTHDGRYVFATYDAGTNKPGGGVAVVDMQRREVVASWNYPGDGRPHGIAFSKKRPL